MRVLYVSPMIGEVNPAIDAIGLGLQHSLLEVGIEMRTLGADFREPDCVARTAAAIREGTAAGVDAIAFYALDPLGPGDAVGEARAAGIPVFTFVRPFFPVNAAVVFPNFNHGVLMAEWLGDRLAPGSRIGIIGGPDTPDDAEEVAGLLYAFGRQKMVIVNDPTDRSWCNLTDVASGGEVIATRLLETYDDLDALVPYNDETMLGTLQALERAGRPDGMMVVSRNGSPEAVEEVRAGRCQGTWDLDASGIGTTLGDLVVRHLTVAPMDEFLGISPVGRMIHAANIDTWRPWSERITYQPFTFGLDPAGA
jgi:ABC-type sugar transport system substrate-binding protein